MNSLKKLFSNCSSDNPMVKTSIIYSLFACSPAFVRDPEVSPFMYSLKTEFIFLYLIIIVLKLILAPFKAINLLFFPIFTSFETPNFYSQSVDTFGVVLWESGLWNDNVLKSIPPSISSFFNCYSTYKYYKKFSPLLAVNYLSICFRLLLFSFSFSWQHYNFRHILQHFIWIISFSWQQQYALYSGLEQYLNKYTFKRLYYPLEMFADSRIIWSYINRNASHITTYSSLHTHFTHSRFYFKSIPFTERSLCPSYLVVPDTSLRNALTTFGYPGNILEGYTPRLSYYGEKNIISAHCINSLDIVANTSHQICVLFNAMLFDKINFLLKILQFRIISSSKLKSNIIIKFHPCDQNYIMWTIIFKIILTGLRYKILSRFSSQPDSCIFLSVGSYYGYCLYCKGYPVYFLTSSFPTFLDPINDLV